MVPAAPRIFVSSFTLTVSNSMTMDFCLEAVEAAIRDCGVPEILNTDQGSQFTGTAFVELVQQHQTTYLYE